MQLSGTHHLRAHREDVWAVLLDPATPARLLPGSGTAEVGPGGLVARLQLRDGPVAQDCDVVVDTRVVPGGHRLEAIVATRGALGRCEVRVGLRLVEDLAGTCELEHRVDVRVTGLLRWWGGRALRASAETQVDQVVARLQALLPAPVVSSVHGDYDVAA